VSGGGSSRNWRARLAALPAGWVQLIRFAIVGGLGTVTNLALFYALVDLGEMGPLVGALVCFAVAVSQNYVLNELWTFATDGEGEGERRGKGRGELAWSRYAKFVLASLLGLAVNAAVLAALIAGFAFPLLVIPQAVGILAGTAVNFLASRYVVFQRSR
jgi:putative flippase GtrA